MNYLTLLSEIGLTHNVFLGTDRRDQDFPAWNALAVPVSTMIGSEINGDLPGAVEVTAATPEAAVRGLYLLVNPIPPNTLDGSLKETL